MVSLNLSMLPSLRRQHLLAEFTGLKQACPDGVYVGLTPGDPSLWSGVIFVRDGPYAPAVMRFQISFPDSYPKLPPLVTFATDMFHPLITPHSTHMYSADVQDSGTVSATDVERLPPGGFSLRHGFPAWFGRRGRKATEDKPAAGDGLARQTPHRPPPSDHSSEGTPGSRNSAIGQSPDFLDSKRKDISIFEILHYIRSTFDNEDVLDSIHLEAAGNPGAWHAWRAHRLEGGKEFEASPTSSSDDTTGAVNLTPSDSARKPGEWNWEGVWEERVKKGISASLSEPVMFGSAGVVDDVVHFLNMGDDDLKTVKENLLRTLDHPS